MADLTKSPIDRQNILNNQDVIRGLKEALAVEGMLFHDEYRFTRHQVAEYFSIDQSTLDRYLANHESELKHNGYVNFKGKLLAEFKQQFGWMLAEGAKAPQLGIFNFRAFINLGMLLTDSEKAKTLRSILLDILISNLNTKAGGDTKFINQRDSSFLLAIAREPHYRKIFTSALSRYVEGDDKYGHCTDIIYKAIFKENAAEYKSILRLSEEENPRDTMYSEVLKLISAFEQGIADELKAEFDIKGEKLTMEEVENIIEYFSTQNYWKPLLEDARTRMASRDYGLRDVEHTQLKEYITSLSPDEYNRFLGEGSMELRKRIEQNIDLFKRLKDK